MATRPHRHVSYGSSYDIRNCPQPFIVRSGHGSHAYRNDSACHNHGGGSWPLPIGVRVRDNSHWYSADATNAASAAQATAHGYRRYWREFGRLVRVFPFLSFPFLFFSFVATTACKTARGYGPLSTNTRALARGFPFPSALPSTSLCYREGYSVRFMRAIAVLEVGHPGRKLSSCEVVQRAG